jgi:MYXO-CTERM domain-containing protein
MQSRVFQIGLLLFAALVCPSFASASVVYSNGSLDADPYGSINISDSTLAGPPITVNEYEVSNPFVSAGSYNLTSVSIGVWELGGTPLSFDWAIGTSPFLGDIASGTSSVPSSLSNVSAGSNSPYDKFTSTLAISGTVNAGTYYITLKNGTNTNSTDVFWDNNGGPTNATYRINNGAPGGTPANVFTINGDSMTTSSTPEPASLAIWGLGALGLAAVGRARRRKA